MAKIINETHTVENVNGKVFNVYVEESKCNWYVTIHQVGWAMPHIKQWKVAKKRAKTTEEAWKAAYYGVVTLIP